MRLLEPSEVAAYVRTTTRREVTYVWLSGLLGGAVLAWGNFVTITINFLIVAFALFLVVKAYNRFRKETPSVPSAEVTLLTEIRDELQKA